MPAPLVAMIASRTRGDRISVSDMASGKLKGVDLQARIAKILSLVAGRF
ncbi:MAG: hypothetical protein QOE66_1794 [Chloroflexota bacterium]|nr:hypothetical protein [Chloroflexota bacterium]